MKICRLCSSSVIVAIVTTCLSTGLVSAQPPEQNKELQAQQEHQRLMTQQAKLLQENAKIGFDKFLYPGSELGMWSIGGDMVEGRIDTNSANSLDFKLSSRTIDDIEKVYNYYIKVVSSLYPGDNASNFNRDLWTSLNPINSVNRWTNFDGSSVSVSVYAPDVRRDATRNSFSVVFQKGRQTFILSARNVTKEEFWFSAFGELAEVAHKTHIDLLLLTPPKPQNVVATKPAE